VIRKTRPFALLSIALLGILSTLVAAQNGGGGVDQPADNSGGGGANGTGSNQPKPEPWKFLAKPNGVLDAATWNPLLKSLDCDEPCKVPDKLGDLLGATIGAKELAKSKPTYVIMHVVQYGDTAKDGSAAPGKGPDDATITDRWYLYRSAKGRFGEPKWTWQKFTNTRIYGSETVYFLFLHMNAGALSLENATRQVRQQIEAARTAAPDAAKDPLGAALSQLPVMSDADLGAFIQTKDPKRAVQFCDATTGDHLQWTGRGVIVSKYMRIRYEAQILKRTPANVKNLQAILGLLFGQAHAAVQCVKVVTNDTLWGAGRLEHLSLPSDITIQGYVTKEDLNDNQRIPDAERASAALGSSEKYVDEQLYWWDASIGIPVHKIKDLNYSDTDNTVTATQVDRQSAYAMFNLMLMPVDLSNPADNIKPRLLVGFPLASNPWDKLFAGGAIGLPLKPLRNFQFFAGMTFLRTTQPATLTAGQTATGSQLQNDLRIKTTPKFTFGINVPVLSVIDKLKK
jgi:hypothetical protein